jgi:hypothetical protein
MAFRSRIGKDTALAVRGRYPAAKEKPHMLMPRPTGRSPIVLAADVPGDFEDAMPAIVDWFAKNR